jgi:hypothetical protein
MINYRDNRHFLWNTMDNGSHQRIRQTFYAVLIGVSPMLVGLILLAFARFIIYRLEVAYYRRQTPIDRRSSSSYFSTGRPTLSYTPVSMTELHRIIQGDYHSQQLTVSSTSLINHDQHGSPRQTKSILTSHGLSSSTLANLVIRRDAIDSTPFTALFAPMSTVHTINEQRTNLLGVQHECTETTALAALHVNRSKIYDFYESDSSCLDRLLPVSQTRTKLTATVVVGESLEFHSTSSLSRSHDPFSANTKEHV